jgi:predicted permease
MQLISVFVNVVVPVFVVALIGYLAAPRLKLDARTISRTAYYIFAPAFVFDLLSQESVQIGQALRMVAFVLVVYTGCGLLGFLVARVLRRPRGIVAAYILMAVYSNSGNFGLSLTEFRFGEEALALSTIYFLAITVFGFVVGVAAAGWARGGGWAAIIAVLKTPVLIAVVPALFFAATGIPVPGLIARITDLLGRAAIPLMLVTLGVQLSRVKKPRISRDVLAASVIRLVGGPALGFALASVLGLGDLERSVGILQASTPVAVTTTIIALEHDLAPDFVTTALLFSTVASLVTMTVVLSLI